MEHSLEPFQFWHTRDDELFKGISQCSDDPVYDARPDSFLLGVDVDGLSDRFFIEEAVCLSRMDGKMGMDDDDRPIRQRRQGLQDLADSRSPRRTAAYTKRYVGAESAAQCTKIVIREPQFPKPVQSAKDSGTVRTASGKASGMRFSMCMWTASEPLQ